MKDYLWVERYRPKTIDDCVLTPALKQTFQSFVDKKEVPNLLLSGSSGVGKTTVAKAMLNQLDLDHMLINGSMKGNIDTLRNEISRFASSKSLRGGRKYVILDESDFLNCLEENERIMMADGTSMALKDFSLDKTYDVMSFNMHTCQYEDDVAEVVNIDHKKVFEVEMEDGRTIQVTEDHPFIVKDSNGKITERTIKQGLDDVEIISMCS